MIIKRTWKSKDPKYLKSEEEFKKKFPITIDNLNYF